MTAKQTERVLMKGNEAMAEAAIQAGCRHFFGYPITPSTEIAAYMSKRMPKVGGTYLQAESEVAAINMVLGAAAAGVRVMTGSSSPGISLKSEGVSYLAGCDLPCVIINVQRGGPGLGGIQPSQADYWQATKAWGHGDFQILVYAPSTVQEMVNLMMEAFDKADEYRIPALMLVDGLLGQMMEPIAFPEKDLSKLPEKPWATNGHKNKREHNIVNSLCLKPDELEQQVIARFARYDVIKEREAKAEEYLVDDADMVLVAFGATARTTRSAVDMAREKGIKAGMIRPITLWPFPEKIIQKAAKTAQCFLSVEMSMGQMIDDIKLAISCAKPVHFYGRTGGMVPMPVDILAKIEELARGLK